MKKEILFLFFVILAVKTMASSFEDIDIIREVREAKKVFEIEQKRKEEEEIQRLLEEELLRKELELKPPVKKTGEKKFLVKEIVLEDAIFLDEKIKKNIVDKYTKKKIGMSELYSLIGELTNEYIKKGYTTTRVTIPLNQTLASGFIKLKVIPGIVEGIAYRKLSFRDKVKVNLAFPTKAGEYLNLFDLEQGISNMNSVVYNNIKMDLIPGSELGKSIVYIQNQRKFSGISLSYDNSGQESTGKNKLNMSLTTGDLLGNDTLTLNGNTNTDGDRDLKFSNSFSLSYNIPVGYWNGGISYSYSNYRTTVDGVVKPVKSEGNSKLTSYKLGKVLGKAAQGKVKFETNLTMKEKEDFINDEKIEVSSRKTANWKNKISYIGKLKGGSLYSDFTYTVGLKQFGASKDLDTSSKGPKSDYNKYTLNLRWTKPFFVKNQYFTYEFGSGMQYSSDTLYSADKFSIGDDLTVRGYESGVSGEEGYYFRNQVTYNLLSLVSGKRPNFFRRTVGKLKIFAGIDFGSTRDKEDEKIQSLLGMGYGIKYTGNYLNWDLNFGKGLKCPNNIEKSELFNFNILLTF